MQLVSRQQIDKNVPTATNTNTTIELLLETECFLRGPRRGELGQLVQLSLARGVRRDGSVVVLTAEFC
jgi:hypothetical protein